MVAVLVTGGSTGIGRKITERLAQRGCFVYATARKSSDLRTLDSMANVQAVRLDLTNPDDIAAAVDAVNRAGRGLYGLVNNAGISTYGAVVDMSDAELELIMDVNVIGPYRVAKAFAPLIIAAAGRIVTIGSIAGVLAKQNLSAYSMSKHALEAFTDSFAAEMEPHGVAVSIIEPGTFNTNLVANSLQRLGDAKPRGPTTLSTYEEPDRVAVAAVSALLDPKPKRRYLVVTKEAEARATIRKQLEQLAQLNEASTYIYDRETLVGMLDDALSTATELTDTSSGPANGPQGIRDTDFSIADSGNDTDGALPTALLDHTHHPNLADSADH